MDRPSRAEVNLYMSEEIQCFNCKKIATLRQEKITAYCQGCCQFFCCYIAGRCSECQGEFCFDCVKNTKSLESKEFKIICDDCLK